MHHGGVIGGIEKSRFIPQVGREVPRVEEPKLETEAVMGFSIFFFFHLILMDSHFNEPIF